MNGRFARPKHDPASRSLDAGLPCWFGERQGRIRHRVRNDRNEARVIAATRHTPHATSASANAMQSRPHLKRVVMSFRIDAGSTLPEPDRSISRRRLLRETYFQALADGLQVVPFASPRIAGSANATTSSIASVYEVGSESPSPEDAK